MNFIFVTSCKFSIILMLITGLYQPILWLADRFFIRINKDFIVIIIIIIIIITCTLAASISVFWPVYLLVFLQRVNMMILRICMIVTEQSVTHVLVCRMFYWSQTSFLTRECAHAHEQIIAIVSFSLGRSVGWLVGWLVRLLTFGHAQWMSFKFN